MQPQTPSPLSSELARDLARALPNLVTSASEVDRVFYARDLWPRHHLATRSGTEAPSSPAVVVWPKSTAEVAALVSFAASRGVPVVPFGAGSGVCAGVLPSADAIVVDMKRMNAIRDFDLDAQRLDVEAGALGLPLEEELARRGSTLGHFPSSILCSTVGGWVATRSAGQASGYYGKIEDMVVGVEAVTGSGDIVTLRRRRFGPDLSSLVVGSEGALAIVTSATLRVHPAPLGRTFGAFSFRDVAGGIEAMRRMFQAGLRPAVCRLYDPFDASLARSGRVKRRPHHRGGPHVMPSWRDAVMRAAISRSGALNAIVHGALAGELLGGALLVLVFERAEAGAAAADLARARRLIGPLAMRDEGEGPARRWLAHRYAVSFRQSPALRSGLFVDTFEVAAPWSRLEGVFNAVRRALGAHAFVMAHFSHPYPDGCCIYFSFAGAGATQGFERASKARYDAAWRDALTAAIESGATIAHHHGVGRSKASAMAREIPGSVSVMRALKRAFDPHGILNPGVLAPLGDHAPEAPGDSPAALPTVDDESMLARLDGSAKMADVVRDLSARGLRLAGDVAPSAATVASWLAAGARGAPDPFADPVDHVVAGLTISLPHGEMVVPPVPRRATGPDFACLAVGARGELGATVASAWVRIARTRDAASPLHAFAWDDGSALSAQERDLTEAIKNQLAAGVR